MARKLKCYGYCNEKHEKENLEKIGSKNYCKDCATVIKKERKDRDVLYQTIQKVFNIPYPNGMMLRQIKQFKQDRNYTYEGITKTICYFITVGGKKPHLNGALSFLPYWYDNAQAYYDDQEQKRKETEDVEIKRTKLKISPLKLQSRRDELKKKAFISMEGLVND